MPKPKPRSELPVLAYSSAGSLLAGSLAVFFKNFGFIAAVTLAAYAPLKFVMFSICGIVGVSPGGVASSIIRDVADGFSASLVAPALILGLVSILRDGRAPAVGDCLSRGLKLWWPTFWNDLKVQITVGLRLLLLIIPGVRAAIRLCLVEQVVALEPENRAQVLDRSREITAGHGWTIFLIG